MVPERGVPVTAQGGWLSGAFGSSFSDQGLNLSGNSLLFVFNSQETSRKAAREVQWTSIYPSLRFTVLIILPHLLSVSYTHTFFFFSEPFGTKLGRSWPFTQVFQHVSPKNTDLSYTTTVVTKFRPGICDVTLLQPWDLICRPLYGVSDCPSKLGSCLTFGCYVSLVFNLEQSTALLCFSRL